MLALDVMHEQYADEMPVCLDQQERRQRHEWYNMDNGRGYNMDTLIVASMCDCLAPMRCDRVKVVAEERKVRLPDTPPDSCLDVGARDDFAVLPTMASAAK